MATNHYFKRTWEESTGDELTDSWGTSTFYFETDQDMNPIRQMQVFENGKILKYDEDNFDDNFGGLADYQFELEEFEEYRISRDEFEKMWETTGKEN